MKTFLIKKKILIIFFVVLFVGLVFLIFPKFSNKIVNFTYTVFTPIQTCFQKTTKQIKASWDFFNQLKKIQKDNYILKQKIERLTAENVRLKELEKAPERIRKRKSTFKVLSRFTRKSTVSSSFSRSCRKRFFRNRKIYSFK